jgi:Uma2 family endonuclease
MALQATTPIIPPTTDEYSWPAQGEWTYEDYRRLPNDGRRYEIIEGVLYVTNAPSYAHQFTVARVFFRLTQFVEEVEAGIVLTAPFEIELPGIARPVLPDIVFIRAEKQPAADAANFVGAPDLIVEVLSPGTFRVDQSVKLDAYERAGVTEYWLADPKTRSVTIYALPENGSEYILHGQFGPDETLTSQLLPDLQIHVANLFTSEA